MLNKLIKILLLMKLRKDPEWCGTTFGINETTDIHVIVETWRCGNHCFGTREDEGHEKEKICEHCYWKKWYRGDLYCTHVGLKTNIDYSCRSWKPEKEE